MAIHFEDDIDCLVDDLKQLGYSVEQINTPQGSPGRSVDVKLQNEVTVSWDRYSRLIWASGPYPRSSRIEYLLALYYGGPLPVRLGLKLWQLSRGQATRLFTKKSTARAFH